ncbi:GntR family transcriptional regulator [Terrarubrum flagellatum]|uniref:GntR family transcriptional regulator n=1 Tax=Terrirubrum flagellatum TaxID=2895980 RepID=UPI0031450FF4
MFDASSPFARLATPPGAEPRIETATRRLRQAVVSCDLAPGAFVNEASLVERFSLGRAGVRVALTALSAAGFVSRHARQGWRIAPIDGRLVEAVLDARRRLEPSLATLRPTDADRKTLLQLSETVAAASGRTERAALATARAADRQLRNLLAAAADDIGRRWFADMWDHADRIIRSLDLAGHPIPADDRRALIDAIAAGDETTARQAIEQDIERYATAVARGLMATDARRQEPAPRSARRRLARPAASIRIETNNRAKE